MVVVVKGQVMGLAKVKVLDLDLVSEWLWVLVLPSVRVSPKG